eukprot:5902270-Pyramimonas_sp.AAC.1
MGPTNTLSRDGVIVADPLSSLASEGDAFSKFWGAGVGNLAPPSLLSPLPRATPEEPRAVSKTDKKTSAVTYDGFGCRHFQHLSEDGHISLGVLFELMESLGQLPRQISAVLLVMLTKPTGGYRPIGVFCS